MFAVLLEPAVSSLPAQPCDALIARWHRMNSCHLYRANCCGRPRAFARPAASGWHSAPVRVALRVSATTEERPVRVRKSKPTPPGTPPGLRPEQWDDPAARAKAEADAEANAVAARKLAARKAARNSRPQGAAASRDAGAPRTPAAHAGKPTQTSRTVPAKPAGQQPQTPGLTPTKPSRADRATQTPGPTATKQAKQQQPASIGVRGVEAQRSDDGKERLSKVLAAAGVASRRASEDLIAQGVVQVNGKQVTSQILVDPEQDEIRVNGKKVQTRSAALKTYHFVLNKPKGYICSNATASDDTKEGMRVVDLLQPWLDAWAKEPNNKGRLPPRFYTVGRLDVATTGLIFVTNDGQWANKVMHPSSDLTKEYLLLVDPAPSKEQLRVMMRGVEIDGVRVVPLEVTTLEESVRLRVVVSEGKKHEAEAAGGGHTHTTSTTTNATTPHNFDPDTYPPTPTSQPSLPTHPESPTPSPAPVNPDSANSPQNTSQAHQGCATIESAGVSSVEGSGVTVPRFRSDRLVVQVEGGVRLWVWDIAAWQMSRAMRAEQQRVQQSVPPSPLDLLTGDAWTDAPAGARAARGTYRGGAPLRRPLLRRWPHMPVRVVPPTAPNARTPQQWAALWRARSARREQRVAGTLPALTDPYLDPYSTTNTSLFASQSTAPTGTVTSSALTSIARSSGYSVPHGDTGLLSFVDIDAVDWKVRLLAAAAGLEVLSLKRVRMGGFRLPRSLKLGEYQLMTPAQIKSVTDQKAQDAAIAKPPAEQKYVNKSAPALPSQGPITQSDIERTLNDVLTGAKDPKSIQGLKVKRRSEL